MEIKRYKECLQNIDYAIKTGYPEEKKSKLLERKAECEQAMKGVVEKKNEVKIKLKLTRPANPKLPYLADCLEMRNDQKYGNYIVTTQQLQPGDVIATEDFFYYSLTKRHDPSFEYDALQIDNKVFYQFCAYCFSSNLLNLFPCTSCTITMYCSEKCRKSAFEYHKYECQFIELFKMHGVGTRMFFQALSICNGDIRELHNLINSHVLSGNPQLTAFDLDYTTMSENEIKKKSILIAYSGIPSAREVASLIQYKFTQFNLERDETTAEMMRTHGTFIIRFIKRMDRIHSVYGHSFIKPLQKANAPLIVAGKKVSLRSTYCHKINTHYSFFKVKPDVLLCRCSVTHALRMFHTW
jgi:hypothetical protein